MPLLWLVSTSLKGPAEDIFSSPPALLPAQPSVDAYVRLFQDNPLTTYLFNSTVVSGLAAVSYTHLTLPTPMWWWRQAMAFVNALNRLAAREQNNKLASTARPLTTVLLNR